MFILLYLRCTVTQTSNLVVYKEVIVFVVRSVPTTEVQKAEGTDFILLKPARHAMNGL